MNAPSRLVAERWEIKKKIGSGSFGAVYSAEDIETNQRVAIKFESKDPQTSQLLHEYSIYEKLNAKYPGRKGFAKVFWYGKYRKYCCLVLERLGPSLEDLFNYCGRTFSVKTVVLLADQLLTLVESFHEANYLHRDIKPDNFVIGINGDLNLLHLIDFGLSKKFMDGRGVHIPYRDRKQMTGTARYASKACHAGFEQGRKDELESLGFVLMYFLRGRLPWQGLKAKTQWEKNRVIWKRKQATSPVSLCFGFPVAFRQYFIYLQGLKFEDKPDYEYLRSLFRKFAVKKGFYKDPVFDWIVLSTQLVHFEETDDGKQRQTKNKSLQNRVSAYLKESMETDSVFVEATATCVDSKITQYQFASELEKTENGQSQSQDIGTGGLKKFKRSGCTIL